MFSSDYDFSTRLVCTLVEKNPKKIKDQLLHR